MVAYGSTNRPRGDCNFQQQVEIRERQRREEEERRELARIAALQQAKGDELLKNANAWKDAAVIRAYVAAVCSASAKTPATSISESWTPWALAEADRLDPIASGRTFHDTV
jgi:hypothetical protein